MTGDEMTARLVSRFRDPLKVIVTAAEWLEYLQEGYDRFIGATPHWPFLEVRPATLTFAAGDNSHDLPDDVWKVRSVWNATDQFKLEELQGPPGQYRSLYPLALSVDEGVPVHYRVFADTLEVFPQPSTETCVVIEVPQRPALLECSTEPIFPEDYHNALVEWALSQAYVDDGQLDMAENHEQRFAAIVQEAMHSLLNVRGERYPAITDDLFEVI